MTAAEKPIVDGVHASHGKIFLELGEPMTLAEFRPLFTGPLMGNCGDDQASAEVAIACGDADLISLGRPFISNPDLVERFKQRLAAEPASRDVSLVPL